MKPPSKLIVIVMESKMNDKTTDSAASHLLGETTSQSTKPPKNGGKVAGYKPAKDAGQVIGYSHSTRLPKDSNQVAGYRSKLLVALIVGTTFSLPAAAKLYKWVDDNGTTHYGETIPPEYANKDRSELNKSGRVIKTEEVLTPEKRRAKEQEDAKKLEATNAALEQQRRDKTLINTYNSVKEIDLARSRNLQQIEARINIINSSIKTANDNLAGLQKEAENYTKRNKKVPPSLDEDLQEAQARMAKLQKDLEQPQADKAAMNARYDADKARYIELTGKK
jgi:hypothetical protein